MRIIGGVAAGRILKVPKGFKIRPTPDLVRQALFNSLGARIPDARILELFGGTGALSLESLSRGARLVVCVEKAPRHAQMIRENLVVAGLLRGSLELVVQDVFHYLRRQDPCQWPFDLILADPPFGQKNVGHRSRSLSQQLLDDPRLPGFLSADGLLVLGHATRDTLSLPMAWKERKVLRHGDSCFRYLYPMDVNQHPR